jgi:hypothetical protein
VPKKFTVARRLTLGFLIILVGISTAVGGLIYWGVTLNAGEDRYGSVDLPGQTTARLPAGRVDLTFTMDLANQTVAIPVMQMTITPLDGGAGATVDSRMGAALDDNGVTHIRVGTAVIARAGDYRITADGDVSASPNPQLRIGLRTNPFPVVLTTLAIGALLVIAGIVVLVRLLIRKPDL